MKIGRNLVAGLQERTGFTETIGNGLSVKENNLENTRTPLIRLGKRVRELRIRRLGVRIPSRAQVKPRVPFTLGAFLLPLGSGYDQGAADGV